MVRRRRPCFFVATLLSGIVALFASGRAEESSTILCLGDSITEGASGFSTYREFLVPALKEAGLDLRFVGPKEDEISAHAGYGGKNSAYLRSVIGEIYARDPADFVLLHSGHNHFSKDQPVPGILTDTETIIETIHRINPDAVILLAQVIPAGKLPKYDYLPLLNRKLAELAGRMMDKGHPVILVNLAEGFDWHTDTVADRVHPNARGARKMADRWMKALSAHLETNQ